VILQKIQFPGTGEKEHELYFRTRHGACVLDSLNEYIKFENGQELSFDTYFNAFSCGKWKKYTCLNSLSLLLRLKGLCDLVISRLELNRTGDGYEEYVMDTKRLDAREEKTEFEFPLTLIPAKGAIAFRLYALTDVLFFGGAYITADSPTADVNLALCICTYKREEYVRRNMAMLTDKVFLSENSALREHLYVYIADNGQTLKQEEFRTTKIKVFTNINTGGAGGFARGMLEALADREEHNLTHVVLMDDDVIFTHHTLERLYAFLRMLKQETAFCMLGGAMFNMDAPTVLHASGESYMPYRIIGNKQGLRMDLTEHFLLNDEEEPVNCLGWWFCCFPVTKDLKNNLPLPLFYQGDDLDFSLRNSDWPKITLNGICVRHENLLKKRSAGKAYFWERNMAITSSVNISPKIFSKRSYQKYVLKSVIWNLLLYRYKEAELTLCAADDFLKGIEWLAKQDVSAINKKASAMVDTMVPVSELPFDFSYRRYAETLAFNESGRRRFIRLISLNGWLLRAKGETAIPAANPNRKHLYRVRRVLHYDQETKKGYITQKSWREALRVFGKLIAVFWRIERSFKKTVKHNREVYHKYIAEEFWREYLGL